MNSDYVTQLIYRQPVTENHGLRDDVTTDIAIRAYGVNKFRQRATEKALGSLNSMSKDVLRKSATTVYFGGTGY